MVAGFVVSFIAAAPALLLLILDIGRHEGQFRHAAVTLGFVGGLFLGMLVSVLLAFGASSGILWRTVALPLVVAMPAIVAAGLPQFREEREAIWVGGATALGVAAMMSQWWAQVAQPETITELARLFLGAGGLALALYGAGLRGSRHARWNRHIPGWLTSWALLVPAFILRNEVDRGGVVPLGGAWIMFALFIAYGAGLTVWAIRSLPPVRPRDLRHGAPHSE